MKKILDMPAQNDLYELAGEEIDAVAGGLFGIDDGLIIFGVIVATFLIFGKVTIRF